MSDLTDIDALAAEYVLGTLEPGERVQVAARRQREPQLEAAIAAWEARLAPLADAVPPVAPPADLLAKIEQRLGKENSGASVMTSQAQLLERRLRRWRHIALGASAIAASLLVTLGWREYQRPAFDQNYVAVFQKDDASPAFVMSVDLTTKTLTVRRVAAEVPAGKTYQLWIASDKLPPGPQSLGLVEAQSTQVRDAIAAIDPAVVQTALFGVSLEPAGGSPKPTGPVFHARLIPTSP